MFKNNYLQNISGTSLTPQAGLELNGIDARRSITKGTADELLSAVDHHGVILLRQQQLTPETFIDFARGLGTLAAHPLNTLPPPGLPELMLQSNIVKDGKPIGYAGAERQWRIDGAHLATPYRCSIAYAAQVPGAGLGDTWFCAMSAAYDALAPALRTQLTGLRAMHPYGTGRKRRVTPYFADSGMTQIFKRGVEHPVVRVHPRTKRRSLYVAQGCTSLICGMNERDGSALLEELYRHLAREEFVYRHAWQAGDLMIWDNASVQYRTDDNYSASQPRLLYRTQLSGK